MNRQTILETATAITHKDRNASYGEPEDNFGLISKLEQPYLEAIAKHRGTLALFPHDVAVLNILQKIARVVQSPECPDHWVDIAGYAACGGQCTEKLPPLQTPTDPAGKGGM